MNAALLLEHYARIADAPDAIARLRRFVLDLAVRGKLVEQDAGDEPASDLFERIKKVNASDGQKRRGKARDTSAGNALENLPFDAPKGWTFVSLGELVRVLNGRAYKQQELLDKGTPVLRVGNLFTSNHWYYSDLALDDDKHCDAGDLIYAWSASFGPFIWKGPRVIYHYHIWKLPLVSEADLDKHYLYTFLLQKTREIKEAGHGISMVHMTKEKMEKLIVPLPPLAEQHRIVAKVDELMALCDQLEAARAEREAARDTFTLSTLAKLNTPDPETFGQDAHFALAHLAPLTTRPDQIKQLRQTILNLAVRGKLVEQDAADEQAAELLRRLGMEVVPERTEAAHLKLPDGWEWAQVDDCFFVSGGMQKTPARAPKQNAFPYLGVGNVYRGRLDLVNVKQFELVAGELERFRLEYGDILVVEGNGSASEIGRCAVWRGEIENCVHQNHIIRCRPKDMALTPYAVLYLNSPDGMSEMTRLAITSAGLFSLSVGKIRKIPIPVPPLAEQHRIVAKVDELVALCDQLEASITTGEQTRSRLMEAVLHNALEPA